MSIKTSDVEFKLRIRQQIEDPIMRKAVANAQERIGANRQKMVDELGHWEEWRDRASQIRDHVLSNLDAYLYQLSEKVTENGGHVYFAKTKEDATRYILQVAQSKNAQKVVKSKSMVTEEIGVNHVLQDAGIQVIETDLGEYILQLDQDPPSHVVVPAIHKDRYQIRRVLNERLGYDGPETPEAMTLFIRQKIREDFLSAEIGITGGNRFSMPGDQRRQRAHVHHAAENAHCGDGHGAYRADLCRGGCADYHAGAQRRGRTSDGLQHLADRPA